MSSPITTVPIQESEMHSIETFVTNKDTILSTEKRADESIRWSIPKPESFNLSISSRTSYTPAHSLATAPQDLVKIELQQLLTKLRTNRVTYEKDVETYLLEHPDLIEVVDFAVEQTRKLFPDNKLRLSLYTDPESGEEILTLYVSGNNDDEDLWEKINQVRYAYAKHLYNKSAWFFVTCE
ncbi:hypothetical protein QQE94_00615 [Fervidobacterium pennivorans subsp. shakshaketiis]|uniref:hypothetical protein n=1 Tax=Fervidobacterium pennivorans TaxID=93466 RepID=UPI00355C65DE